MVELSAFIVPIVSSIVVTALCTFAGSWFAFSSRLTRTETKLDAIEKKQDKHNNVIERVFNVETRLSYIDHAIDDIRNDMNHYHR